MIPAVLMFDAESGELVVVVHDITADEDLEVARLPVGDGPDAGLADRVERHRSA